MHPSLELKQIDDPRDVFEKMTRTELAYLARYEGRDDIDPAMPALIMRQRFRDRRPERMPRPMRGQLGSYGGSVVPPYDIWVQIAFGEAPPVDERSKTVSAEALLEQEWKTDYTKMTMPQLRKAAKAKGLKQTPKDTKASLVARLQRGEDISSDA